MADAPALPDDRFAPLGSAPYYALRLAPADRQPALAAVNAAVQSLLEIPDDCSDPAVARHKLRWWRDELRRAEQGDADHPVAVALARALRPQGLSTAPVDAIAPAVEQRIDGAPLHDEAALRDHCRRLGAARATLFTQLCGGDAGAIDQAMALGELIEYTRLLRNLGQELRRGRCLLPLDPQWLRDADPESTRDRLAELTAPYRQRYRSQLERLPRRCPPLGPTLRLAALADRLLDEIDREGYRVLRQRTSLTPLHKLWIAWRCRRRWG